MPEATVKAQQSEVEVGTTSAEEEVKKVKGRKRSRQSPVQADQKGEMISPLAPLPLTELPPDFDFIASKTDDEKIEYIRSVLARSEDEAIAVIAPALRFYGTAGSVVQAYLPLILEVKKHLCRPGRPRVDPATGERSKTWAEVCEENLHISIRRMQQILASLQEPKLPGKGGTTNRRPAVDRKDYERARQVAAPARSLAEAVVKQGMGDRFPDAIEILKLADIPVPDVEPAGDQVTDPDPGMMEALRQRVSLMADTDEINKELETFFKGLVQPLLEHHPCVVSSTISVQVSRKSQHRICEGDWVKDTYLTNQAGQNETLGRVLGKDKLGRPQIRWHKGQKWTKPFSLLNSHAPSVRVLSASLAAEQFPEAYGSYPAEGEGAAAPSLEATSPLSSSASSGPSSPAGSCGKTYAVLYQATKEGISVPFSGRFKNSGMGSPTGFLTLRTSESPRNGVESSLLDILETGDLPQKYDLSPRCCKGILRRAKKGTRRKKLSPELERALQAVAEGE